MNIQIGKNEKICLLSEVLKEAHALVEDRELLSEESKLQNLEKELSS